jgi:uncharacterized protein (TIGR02246 family)
MADHSPEETVQLFAQYLNSGDLDGALTLYEPGASFLPEPGTVVSGLDAIRAALQGFFALRPVLAGDIQRVVRADDTALVVNAWKLSGTLPDGTAVQQNGTSADVLRRQPDGQWLLLIDDPWG